MTRRCRFGLLLLSLALLVAPPAFSDTYLVYSDVGIPQSSDLYTWCNPASQVDGNCQFGDSLATGCGFQPEGNVALSMTTIDWGGYGAFLLGYTEDLSRFDGGSLEFLINSFDTDVATTIACVPGALDLEFTVQISDYGWTPSSFLWQEISIPICDFFGGTCDQAALDCLATIDAPFVTGIDGTGGASWLVDYVRWEKPVTNPGRSIVEVQGRELFVNGEPFAIEGVAYSPISIGDDWRGAWRDRSDRYSVDFPLMAAAGINTVRLFTPVLSKELLDTAWANGLHVIPTFGINTVQMTCSAGRDFEKDRFLETVNKWKDHPAILFWLVGNEVNLNPGGADLCLDVLPAIDAFAVASKAAEGANPHPVGTNMNDFALLTDICDPGCSSDIQLPNLDLWGASMYRGCIFDTAFTDHAAKANCGKPLIVMESGLDAWVGDEVTGMEDQAFQAACVEDLVEDARQNLAITSASGVSAGHVLFSWTDEWWKTDFGEFGCGTGWENHDSCAPYQNASLPDPNLNEEYWGLVALDDTAPTARSTRDAYDSISDRWLLGNVCNMTVESYNSGSGEVTVSFDQAPGTTDHTLYYGPLVFVSSYLYSGSATGLGATGTATAGLPPGPIFWLVVGRDNQAEGGYSNGSLGERPPAGIAAVSQAANRSGLCSTP